MDAGFPVIVRGKGPYLYDTDGIRYFDAVSSWWACSLGHGKKRVINALKKQAQELQHSILGNLSHPRAIELASKLAESVQNACACQTMPGRTSSRNRTSASRRVMFASDGASAVEAALKIALQYWHNVGRAERRRFVSLEQGYHGDTLGAVSVGYLPEFHKPFKSSLFPVHRAESPFCVACPYGKRPDTCSVECFQSMRSIIEKHGKELAAVIVEPLCQCAAGMRIYPASYLRKLADLCRRHEVLLIADEIAVGMGRTGRMYAFEHAGIDPDIVCIGKAVSSGYLPLSATIAKKMIFDTFTDKPEDRTFYHGHTFAGNPIACAAAIETLAIYEEDDIVAGAAATGRVMAEELRSLAGLPGVAGIRSLGMIGAFEAANARGIRDRLREHNRILVRPLGSTIYLMPPLTVSPAIIRRTVAALRDAIVTW